MLSPIPLLTQFNVQQLRSSKPIRYHCVKPPARTTFDAGAVQLL